MESLRDGVGVLSGGSMKHIVLSLGTARGRGERLRPLKAPRALVAAVAAGLRALPPDDVVMRKGATYKSVLRECVAAVEKGARSAAAAPLPLARPPPHPPLLTPSEATLLRPWLPAAPRRRRARPKVARALPPHGRRQRP